MRRADRNAPEDVYKRQGVSGATTKVNKTSVQVSDHEVAQVQTVKVDGKTQMSMSCLLYTSEFRVFDIIVDLLKSEGGEASKGQPRNYKVGSEKCNEHTVAGAIAPVSYTHLIYAVISAFYFGTQSQKTQDVIDSKGDSDVSQ